MPRWFARPAFVVAALYFGTLLGTVLGLVQVAQIPLDALPADSQRLTAVPVWHFMHVLGGATFGILGPIQFGRVLKHRYGRIHRLVGRLFVAAGAMVALSTLGLLWHFPYAYSALVSGARLVFALALGVALFLALQAIRRRDLDGHRTWMIRAYAIGIGATVVSMVFFPIYLITGQPPQGIAADLAFIGSWTACILLAELLVRRI